MSLVDTVQVRRANVYLTVSREELDKYIAKGYDVVDKDGNVLKASVPTNLGTLQKAYVDNNNEIKTLKAKIKILESQLAEKEKAQPAPTTQPKKSKKGE